MHLIFLFDKPFVDAIWWGRQSTDNLSTTNFFYSFDLCFFTISAVTDLFIFLTCIHSKAQWVTVTSTDRHAATFEAFSQSDSGQTNQPTNSQTSKGQRPVVEQWETVRDSSRCSRHSYVTLHSLTYLEVTLRRTGNEVLKGLYVQGDFPLKWIGTIPHEQPFQWHQKGCSKFFLELEMETYLSTENKKSCATLSLNSCALKVMLCTLALSQLAVALVSINAHRISQF